MEGHVGFDGSLLGTAPETHWLHCILLDTQAAPCISNGFLLLEELSAPDANSFTYAARYQLDDTGDKLVAMLAEAENTRVDKACLCQALPFERQVGGGVAPVAAFGKTCGSIIDWVVWVVLSRLGLLVVGRGMLSSVPSHHRHGVQRHDRRHEGLSDAIGEEFCAGDVLQGESSPHAFDNHERRRKPCSLRCPVCCAVCGSRSDLPSLDSLPVRSLFLSRLPA
jgi:hypothetical protein